MPSGTITDSEWLSGAGAADSSKLLTYWDADCNHSRSSIVSPGDRLSRITVCSSVRSSDPSPAFANRSSTFNMLAVMRCLSFLSSKVFSAKTGRGAGRVVCVAVPRATQGLFVAALTVLDVPAASSLPINVSFGHNFMRPQDAKITGIRFDVYVTPKQSVQVGINDVVASAINPLPFAT